MGNYLSPRNHWRRNLNPSPQRRGQNLWNLGEKNTKPNYKSMRENHFQNSQNKNSDYREVQS